MAMVTWNLAKLQPTYKSAKFLKLFRGSDIVVVCAQECEGIRPRREEGHRSRAWKSILAKSFGKSHCCVSMRAMGGLRLSVYAKGGLKDRIGNVLSRSVACGAGNILANKGGICTVLELNKRKIGFVGVHLAAHEECVQERNSGLIRILSSLPTLTATSEDKKNHDRRKSRRIFHRLNRKEDSSPKSNGFQGNLFGSMLRDAEKVLPPFFRSKSNLKLTKRIDRLTGMTQWSPSAHSVQPVQSISSLRLQEGNLMNVDALFVLGDLNYRLDLQRDEAEVLLQRVQSSMSNASGDSILRQKRKEASIRNLLQFDQLTAELKTKASPLFGLREGKISFFPTYKYDVGSDRFDSSEKRRVPSWTDRILYLLRKPLKKKDEDGAAVHCQLVDYSSVQDCSHGDHRPVFALFNLTVQ